MEIKGYVTARIQFGGDEPTLCVYTAESSDPREFAQRMQKAFDHAGDAIGLVLEKRFPPPVAPELELEQKAAQDELKLPPLALTEDRTDEQKAADGDAPPPPWHSGIDGAEQDD